MDTKHKTKEEIEEHFDKQEKLLEDVKKLVIIIQNSKHCVLYTGAGISTR